MVWKIVCITDTHNHNNIVVPEGDVIIHAGDATNFGKLDELVAFLDWFGNLPHAHKIFVPGNHDVCFNKGIIVAEILCRDNDILLLNGKDYTLQAEGKQDLYIYGAPVHPKFADDDTLWDFDVDIPDGLDILVTHVPPYGIFDEVCENFKQKYLGNYQLLQAVQDKKPKYHVFGHVHPGYGKKRQGDTVFVNACICDNHLNPINPPICFEI
jgi:predicted phosphohydrolase